MFSKLSGGRHGGSEAPFHIGGSAPIKAPFMNLSRQWRMAPAVPGGNRVEVGQKDEWPVTSIPCHFGNEVGSTRGDSLDLDFKTPFAEPARTKSGAFFLLRSGIL